MQGDDLVGISEVAALAGVSRQAIANWRSRRPDFPHPVADLQAGPVFLRGDVVRWLREKRGTMTTLQEPIEAVDDGPAATGLHTWWAGDADERFWLETTDRSDLGVDLAAPQSNDRGLEHHGYSLVTQVERGDVVFHYHTDERAIVGWSRATGSLWEEDIVWASHGTVAREAGVAPYRRPGWRHGLDGPYYFSSPIDLTALRGHEAEIRAVRDALIARVGTPIYFPFALSDLRPLRPTQFYMTKMPASFVEVFPQLLAAAVESITAGQSETSESGTVEGQTSLPDRPYVVADDAATTGERDPFEVDPNVVDRSLRAHAATQNALAAYVTQHGLLPLSPRPSDPKFDLAWWAADELFVAEVKSITDSNEEQQLRLGLGQVLRYRHLLGRLVHEVTAVLAVEREPSDATWTDLCEELGVRLIWPASFAGVWEKNGQRRVPRRRPSA